MKLALACLSAVIALAVVAPASSQTYRNVANRRFATVSNGPLQAHVIDVSNLSDTKAVLKSVANRVGVSRRVRESGAKRYIDALKKSLRYRGELTLGAGDIVLLRQSGRLALPATRTRAGGGITYVVPGPGETGGWPLAHQADLQAMIQKVYPEIENVFGSPCWTGTITILNGDNISPIISDPNALSGGIYNVSNNQVILAQYRSVQSLILNLTQMMVLTFRGPDGISFDCWERGMARAATLTALRNARSLLSLTPSGAFGGTLGDYDVSDPLWHALDRYEQLNQPALGNDRFFPVSKKDGEANTSSFPGMLVPRLQMSGSAWLKVLTYDPAFLKTFNTAYYTAVQGNAGLKNDVPGLRALAAAALSTDGVPQIEGLDFQDWFQRQFILDSSVSAGIKLYLSSSPLRPGAGEDDFSLAVILEYYQTAFDTNGNSDELNLNGTSFPVYWDFEFTNRLFLAAQYERILIFDGIGSVAPTFFDVLGGAPDQQSRMRITMDFPVGAETARLHAAPRSMGTQATPNNFWGVVVGADTGKMRIQTDTGVNVEVDVKQGCYGAVVDASAFSRPSRSTLTFTDSQNNQTVRQVVTGFNEYSGVFYVNEPSTSLTHVFPSGAQMVSFPIQPFAQKPADALLDSNTNLPLFTDATLLMAQWRQNLSAVDKYLKNPSMGPLQPGRGYWMVLSAGISAKLVGKSLASEREVTSNLLSGWNQIGTPFNQNTPLTALRFQYLADNVSVDLATAVTKGYIEAADVPGVGQVTVWKYDPAQGYVPASSLEPWVGYFIKTRVSEGLSITYSLVVNTQTRGAATRAARPKPVDGWSVPIIVRDAEGKGSMVYLGQASTATTGFDQRHDAPLPPAYPSGSPRAAFIHDDWGDKRGEFFADIRSRNNRDAWRLTVQTPRPNSTYTLTWGDLSQVPRGLRLILVDKSTGRRQYMQTASGMTLQSGTASTRSFEIIPEIRTGSVLRFSTVTARSTRASGGGAVDISYQLTQAAMVSAEIRDAGGRIIRRLEGGRSADAGINRILWDAKDDRAIAAPAGVYLLQLKARTPEGEAASTVSSIVLVR